MSETMTPERKRALLQQKLKQQGRGLKSYPLSFGQEGLWFIDQMEPGASTYNTSIAVRLKGDLNVQVLQESMNEIIRRHEILRSVYTRVKGRPVQIVVPALTLNIPVIDLRGKPEKERQTEAVSLAHIEQERPFDLARGPVLRVSLVRVYDAEYLMLIVVHHIVFDGWSLGIFVQELKTLYTAFLKGMPSPLPDLSLQYADFAAWQRQRMQGETLDELLAYWKKQLEGTPGLLELPTDRSRPAVVSSRGAVYRTSLLTELLTGLNELSQREEVTLFMTLLAAFKTLLYRYTGQQDLFVATLIANRNRAEIEPLIGFIANTLILRTDMAGNPTFRELLARVREVTLGAYAHQDLPYGLLIETLRPERNLSRAPLYQVGFALQNTPIPTIELPGLTLSFLAEDQIARTAKADLSMVFEEVNGEIFCEVEYSTDLFEEETIKRLTGHWQTLLRSIIAKPDLPLLEIPLLTSDEQQQLLHTWNATQRNYPRMQCVHELFEEQARRTPEVVAVEYGAESMTYSDLNRRANQVACCLRDLGVKPGDLVGIFMERSLEMIVSMLAILKAGGAYVPLDPTYPVERLSFMLEDTRTPVILTQREILSQLPEHTASILCLDTSWSTVAHASEINLPRVVNPSFPAYVIYTSGSTGKPKGVMVPHMAINRLVCNADYVPLRSDDRIAQISNCAFDAATFEIWGALLNGARLIGIAKDVVLSPQELAVQLRAQRISALFLTTALFNQVAREVPTAFNTQRHVLFGGEAVDPRWVHEVLYKGAPERLLHVYGPTECTTFATWHLVEFLAEDANTVPIGQPITNTQTYVLDAHLRPVPVGIRGELYLGGDGLALGYFHSPDLTAEKFIPNPFSTRPGERLYRTGDLVRYRPNGSVEFIGRVDQQVKIRGFRIEPSEIEIALSQHPEVRDCLVIARDEMSGEKRLIAYVVPIDQPPSVGALRRFLQEKLPPYMLPANFVMLDELPLNPNGKINRQALPSPDAVRPELEIAFSAPQTPAERILAEIWSQVLGLDQVGIHDNFFALGGDSILSIQIVTRAKQAGLQLKPLHVFQYQTITELAMVASSSPAIEHEQGIITGDVPLTPIQSWFFAHEQPRPHHFNQAMFLELSQPANVSALTQAVQQLLVQHDALRLRFFCEEGIWKQVNVPVDLDESSLPVNVVSLGHLSTREQEQALLEQATALQASLDLAHVPLLRITLFDLGPARPQRLLIAIHHLVVDGVSWRILLEDLQASYQQALRGKQIQLQPKTTSFKEWATRLEQYAHSDELTSQLEHWIQHFPQEMSALPVDYVQGENDVASAATIIAQLSEEETRQLLQDVPTVYHTQINDILLSALARAIAEWSEQDHLYVDLESHGREELFAEVDLSRTVGWFTSLFPLLLPVEKGMLPGEMLKAVKERLRRLPHHGIGYGILRYLRTKQAIGRQHPQAQISFNYLGQFDQTQAEATAFHATAYPVGPLYDPQSQRHYQHEVVARVSDRRLQVLWTFSEHFYQDQTIEQLTEHFLEHLRILIQHCRLPEAGGYTPSDFPLTSLTQASLDVLMQRITQVPETAGIHLPLMQRLTLIEDCYRLSPMQQGMLFHNLYAPESGVYVEQMSYTLQGQLRIDSLKQSWQQVVARHASLRTAFHWEGIDEPVQVVYSAVQVPWQELDWSARSPTEQEDRFQVYLKEDRKQGFALDRPPLLRLTLLRLGDDLNKLVWTFHHLLLDGWCLAMVLHEVMVTYEASVQEQEIHLSKNRPYRDYINWIKQQDLHKAETFWRKTLQGFSAPTPLGIGQQLAEHAPERQSGNRYEHLVHTLTSDTTTILQAAARKHHLTLNTLIQGAWALLLNHYSREEDIVFGIIVSGRPAELVGVESMVGLFINTVPLRVRITPGEKALTWLQRIQAHQVEELRQYEYSPLAQVQSWSEIPRGLPLFESIVVFENYPVDASLQEKGRSELEIQTASAIEQTNYPLTLIVSPGRELALQLYYDEERFSQEDIARCLEHLETLLVGLATRTQQTIETLPLLSWQEHEQQIVTWNQTEHDYPQQSVHALFEAQVARTPTAIALLWENQQWSYHELNRRSNQLAHYLRGLGVGSDVLVGICMERTPAMLVAMLAVLKAGGAYIPLDPAYPQERLSFILEDGHAPILLTQQHLVHLFQTDKTLIICVNSQPENYDRYAEENLPEVVRLANLAYVIYTSGSTGQPKGVALTHKSTVALLSWATRTFTPEQMSGVLASTSICFDLSIFELFAPLICGGSVILVENVLALPILPQREEVTLINTVPSAIAELLRMKQIPTSVQVVNLAGEALLASLVRQIFVEHPGIRVYNLYGPSEDTVYSTYACMASDFTGTPPIGRPVANTQVYVLDRYLQPVPVGIPGEIYIGGAGLARGYHQRPDLTAERFVPHPFSQVPGARLYRTGDLAISRKDGNLEFIGRLDHQVKIRGFRIELGEIDAILAQHPQVRESVVLVHEDESAKKRLVAYVVPASEQTLAVDTLRTFLRQRLPEYMLPANVVFLNEMPLTPNGKINRRALPAPGQERPELVETYCQPRTPLEEILAKTWREVLGVTQVGIHDNFFALGGDSIMSLQIIARAQLAGLHLQPKQLFQYQTIAELATVATEAQIVQSEQGLISGTLPLTPIQRWFFARQLPEPHHWNQSVMLVLSRDYDASRLRRALQHLYAHHDALRLRFVAQHGDWQQHYGNVNELVPFGMYDLSHVARDQQEEALMRIANPLQTSLNLQHGPLLCAAFFDLGAQYGTRLLIIAHHLIIDGVSWRVLLEDLHTAYAQLQAEETVVLPAKTTSYKRWAEKIVAYAQSEVLEQEKSYWLAAERQEIEKLPLDNPQGSNTVASAEICQVELDEQATHALVYETSAAYHTQVHELLLAALSLSLFEWYGTKRLLIDLEGHGREELFPDVDLSRTIGWFTALYPVYFDLTQTMGPGDVLLAVKEQLRQVPAHGVGYGVLRYLHPVQEELAALPQAQVLFNYLGQIDQAGASSAQISFAQEQSGQEYSLRGSNSHVLAINGGIERGRLHLGWTYNQNLHHRATIERVAQRFMQIVRELISHCQSPEAGGYTASDFPLAALDMDEFNQLSLLLAGDEEE
jgi:amino acid adenylation domain-containing protein/non-ribosomal peptide synthase protein (TIGR01720 family)